MKHEQESSEEVDFAGLNAAFAKGELIDVHKEELRKIEKPILVDFNNVLVSNHDPFPLNPAAPDFLKELRELGTVIVVTTARNWNGVHDELVKYGLWDDGTLLIVNGNYVLEYPADSYTPDEFGITQEELDALGERGAAASKRIGGVFGKDFDIPLIDDTPLATRDNPGIFGINVEKWFDENEHYYETYRHYEDLAKRGEASDFQMEALARFEEGLSGETLRKAVEEVRKIYGNNGKWDILENEP